MPVTAETITQVSDNATQATVPATKHFDTQQSIKFLSDSGAVNQLDDINEDFTRLRRAMRLRDIPYLVIVEPGEGDSMRVTVQAADDQPAPGDEIMQAAAEWANRRFFLDVDMDAVKKALAVDDYGKMLVAQCWPARPSNYGGPWDALLKGVIHAQIYPGFASKLDDYVRVTYGERVTFDGETINLFPRPIELAFANEHDLRAAKFSRQKADFAVNLSRMLLDDPVTYDFETLRQMPGEDVVKTLKTLRGVGEWNSQNTAMRGLPHLDVFIDEKTTRKAIAPHYSRTDDMNKREVAAAVERFAPYRTFACYYTYMHHFDMGGKG
jgi:3-methyladenine DNA glycosylase/8-oxoguanine DNA glycosylase